LFFFYKKLSPQHTPGEKSQQNTSTCYISIYTLQNVMMQHYDATVDICGCGKSQVS